MNLKKVKLVYFSATGTTQKILESIAKGIAVEDVEHINLTLPENTKKTIGPFSDELVIMGAPVYGGRLPADAINRFKQLKAAKTPVVLIVLYGNREFDDALLELKNISVELGFIPFAGGAFIGEHSFATKDIPIANGRPDILDVQKAKEFGEKIKNKFVALESLDEQMDLTVPGSFPYQAGGPKPMAISPVTDEDACTLCGTCVEVCPTAAISIDKSVSTQTELCLRCSACIKECPEDARSWEDSRMETIINWLKENYSTRKEPTFYGVNGGDPHPTVSFESMSTCKSKCC
jgi:ferredoxin/flavodoxin